MTTVPNLEQFRVEISAASVAHLIFDMPGRSMNIFSESAIRDLGLFAAWARQSEMRGVVVRSGKISAFCVGADLGELSQAYGMIAAAPEPERAKIAFDHFFRLSQAIRALETCGKPVAAAVNGLALGGGCELALGTHHRVAADAPNTAFGLPESLVGLLPGAGGTQRLPRLAGLDCALPILLEGARLGPAQALTAGLVHEIADPGEEAAVAERWVLSAASCKQPWDKPGWIEHDPAALRSSVAIRKQRILAETLGHYPAPLAILDCVERGLAQPFDAALVTEMEIFAGLIQRPEPRDMIAVLFLAKTEYERLQKREAVPPAVDRIASQMARLWLEPENGVEAAALAAGGFRLPGVAASIPDKDVSRPGYWFNQEPDDERKRAVRETLRKISTAAQGCADEVNGLTGLVNYHAITRFGFPAYLGGPFALSNGLAMRP